jgi:transposase-like protein
MDLHVSTTIPGGPLYTVDGVDYEVPSYFDVAITGVPDLPYVVHLGVRMLADGPRAERVEVEQLTNDRGRPVGPYVNGTALRRLAVADLLGRAVEAAATVAVQHERTADGSAFGRLRTADVDERRSFAGRYRRDGQKLPTDERLARVAEVYREAVLLGERPTQAVADAFGIARSTAGRWVQEARDRRYLRPAPGPRIAGEVPEEGEQP